ncbi:hypothetical protein [Desulfurobacterium sp.]
MRKWRRAGHHIGISFGLLAALFLLYIFYRIFFVNNLVGRVLENFSDKPAYYHVIVHYPDNTESDFKVFGRVKVKESMIEVNTSNETYYYQIPAGSAVVVRKLEWKK